MPIYKAILSHSSFLLSKADIRNPLRYLLMNRSRFQRLLSRGFIPLLRQSTFGPPPTPLRLRGGGLIVRFNYFMPQMRDPDHSSVFFGFLPLLAGM